MTNGIPSVPSTAIPDTDPDFIPQEDDQEDGSSVAEGEEVEPSELGPGMLNAPIALTENSSQVYGHAPKDAESRYYRFADEAIRFTLGPMPVQHFLDTFLDCPGLSVDEMPPVSEAFEGVPTAGDLESDIYIPLLRALNWEKDGVRRCPGFTFRNTSKHPDKDGNAIVKPDVTCYADVHLQSVDVDSDYSHTDMGASALFIEVKKKHSLDPFRDPLSIGETLSHFTFAIDPICSKDERDQARKVLGQNAVYAAEICARQHRHCCFSISLSGCHARLMRWDRSGAIATRSFNLHHHPQLLCQFLWRFAHISDAQRGYDITVARGSDLDQKIFLDAIRAHVKLQKGIVAVDDAALDASHAVHEHYKVGAVSVMTLFSGTEPPKELLVCRPLTSPLSVAGRATRAYWAVDRDTHDVVLLKDTWRYMVPGAEEEGDVIAELNGRGVCNVPTLLYRGYVPSSKETEDGELEDEDPASQPPEHPGLQFDYSVPQRSRTQEFVKAPWAATAGMDLDYIIEHIHYRFTLSIAGYSLKSITGTRELLQACYDAFVALLDVHRILNRLHRDISVGNIILYRAGPDEERRGYLVDWDHSWRVDAPNPHAKYWRSATWQFMSYEQLREDPAPHRLQDDLESILYVVMYCGVRWLAHDLAPRRTMEFLNKMFDQSDIWSGKPNGGSEKRNNARLRTWTKRVQFASPALRDWLDIYMACHSRGPTPTREWRYKNFWEKPEEIKRWWSTFLDSHDLPRSDRVDRKLSDASRQVNGEGIEPVSASGGRLRHAATLSTMIHSFSRETKTALGDDTESKGDIPDDLDRPSSAKKRRKIA